MGGGVWSNLLIKSVKYFNGPYKSQNVNVQKYVMVFSQGWTLSVDELSEKLDSSVNHITKAIDTS